MRIRVVVLMLIALLALTACGAGGSLISTGDTSQDQEAAQNYVPASIPGYNVTDATSVSDALTQAGTAGSLLTGNPAVAGLIVQLDSMITCYRNVGAVAARVYTQQDANLLAGEIPRFGVVAVVNTTRLQRNLLECVLSSGPQAQSADAIQPCGGSGSFVVNNENLQYVFAATNPELCQVFQSNFPAQ
jgi:hypothetical protein